MDESYQYKHGQPTDELTFAERLSINEQLRCNYVGGCNLARFRFSQYCSKHYNRNKSYFDPRYKAIKRREYKTERDTIHRLLLLNLQHEAIQGGLRFTDNWLHCAADPDASKYTIGAKLLGHLMPAGVTALEALTEIAACWLFSNHYRGTKIYGLDNQDAFTANRLMRLRPLPGNIRGKDRLQIGHYIRENQSQFLINLCAAADHSTAIRERERQAQTAPLLNL